MDIFLFYNNLNIADFILNGTLEGLIINNKCINDRGVLPNKNDNSQNIFSNYPYISNERPLNPVYGWFFDKNLNKPIWWTGTKWVDATGADV